MRYKDFKGVKISTLGFGGLRLPAVPDDANTIDRMEAQKVIDTAMANGINYFDTAYTYQNGDSERFLGEALKKYPRDSFYFATKYNAEANSDIEAAFEEQLERCQMDYFDFYLFHCVEEISIDAYTDPKNDYLSYLLKQKENGRIRNLGFSSHAKPETLGRFLQWYDGFDMALIQLNYVDWTLLEAKEQYEILTRHHIPVWVMEPMKGGRLSSLDEASCKILKEAAPDKSISSWGFRFLMTLPNVQTVLSGMSDIDQVLDNVQTFSEMEPLSEEEMEVLWKAKEVFMDALGVPCSACRYCCDTCPAELDIPLLIQAYNEKSISGRTWRLASLRKSKRPDLCVGCGECAKHCPQKIDIPQIMEKMKTKK